MEVKSGKAISVNHNERAHTLIYAPLPFALRLSLWGNRPVQQRLVRPCLVSFQGFGYHYGLMNKKYAVIFGHVVRLLFQIEAVNGRPQILH